MTEGSFWGSVRWLRNNRSRGSAHYVVSRGGDVVQLVSTSNVAWHAGAAEGPHELVVYARTAGGRRAARIVPVVVANGDLPPTLDLALDAPVSDAIALP